MAKADLKIDWATHEAAKYACENWHYSGCLPAGKSVKVGVWEDGRFIGVVIFGMGSGNATNGEQYGLGRFAEIAELARVALSNHKSAVTRVISIAVKFLKGRNPKLRMIISFADPEQGHHGGIYQGGNWVYTGASATDRKIKVFGKLMHPRSVVARWGHNSIVWIKDNVDPNATKVITQGKHRYLMPLDKEMAEQIKPLAKPYPKREKQAMASDQDAQRQGGTDLHAPILERSGEGFSPLLADVS